MDIAVSAQNTKAPRLDSTQIALNLGLLLVAVVVGKALGNYTNHPGWCLPLMASLGVGAGFASGALPQKPAPFLIALGLLVAACALASLIPDFDWDTNAYHKPAELALHDGWNPWAYASIEDWFATRKELYYTAINWKADPVFVLQMSHFPNFSWLWGAGMMDWGFNWEVGKAISWCLALMMVLYGTQVFRQYVGRRAAQGCALLLPACFVFLSQCLHTLTDGVTYGASILGFLALLDRGDDRRIPDIFFWLGVTMIAGLKTTGALYAVILAAAYLVVHRVRLWKILSLTVLSLFILSHPYINHVAKGLPVAYPMMDNRGKDLGLITSTISPSVARLQGLRDDEVSKAPRPVALFKPIQAVSDEVSKAPRPVALFKTVFSRTSPGVEFSGLKVPGTFSLHELDLARVLDNRNGGFGPFFSLALTLAAIALVAALISRRKEKGRDRQLVWLAMGLILLMTLVHSVCWRPRYVPFFHAIVVLMVVDSLPSRQRWIRYLAISSMIVLGINGLVMVRGGFIRARGIFYKAAAAKALDPAVYTRVAGAQDFGMANLYYVMHEMHRPGVTYDGNDDGWKKREMPCKDGYAIIAAGQPFGGAALCPALPKNSPASENSR